MILSGLILAAVMVLVLVRPRGLGVAWPALGGAAACLALALVKPADTLAVLAMTWNAGLALVGLLVLSAVLEANGAFRAAAHRIARASGGDGRKLFLGLCALTAAATTLLANDGAILILTPIVAELATLLALPAAGAMAYLFAVGFLCDALSTLLPPSNLTNLLLADALHLTPGSFFLHMLAPTAR